MVPVLDDGETASGCRLPDFLVFHFFDTLPYSHSLFLLLPSHHLGSADDGDYWRLLNAGTHILTATAKGYSRVSKRVYLPHNMKKAGRVDFVLSKVGLFAFRSC